MILDEEIEIRIGGPHSSSDKTVKVEVLRRSARKVLSRRLELVEDAVLTAVIQLYSVSDPDDVKNPKAYGATVARNAALRLREEEQRRVDDPRIVYEKVVSYDFERLLLFLSLLEAVHAQLGARQRQVALLAFLGWRRGEIAVYLGLRPRTISKYLKQIRDLIQTIVPHPPPDKGGGSGGRRGRPPPRADPEIRICPGAGRVALLLHESGSRPKEVYHEVDNHRTGLAALLRAGHESSRPGQETTQLRAGGQGMQAGRWREGHHHRAGAAGHDSAALDELRHLLLQLPAFRELDRDPGSGDPHTAPQDLRDVLRLFLHEDRDRDRR